MKREPDFVDECYADKDLSLLKKLTLVIPTYNRNYYLSRCLWYHAHFPFGEIIVADSSPEKKKVVNRESVKKICSFFGASIRYLEYNSKNDPYGGDIYEKWADASRYIQTEFVQNCTDKEFIIPTTSCTCVSFLEEHNDYSVAEGINYQLSIDENNRQAFYLWAGDKSYTSDLPADRAMKSLIYSRPVGMQFSVQRRENFQYIYQSLSKYKLYDIRFGEAAIELSPLIQGKTHKILGIPGNIRDVLTLKTAGSGIGGVNKDESSFMRYQALQDYPSDRYEQLYKNLSLYLVKTSNKTISQKEAENIISGFIQKRYQYKPALLNKSHFIRFWIEYIWHALPKSSQDKIRIVLGENMLTQPVLPLLQIPIELNMIQISVSNFSSNQTTDKAICFVCDE